MLQLVKTLTGHNSSIYKVIPLDDQSFISLGGDGFIVSWNVHEQDGHLIAQSEDKFFTGCKINDDILVAGAFSGQLYWFDLKKKEIIKRVQHHKKAIFSALMHQSHLYTASEDGCIVAWDTHRMAPLSTFHVSPYGLRSLEVIDEDILAAGDMNGHLFCIDYASFSIKETFKAHDKTVFSILRTEDFIFTGGRDAMLRKWDPESLELQHEIPAHWFTINDIKLNDDKLITASRDKKIRVWDKNLELLQSIDVQSGGHINSVNCLAIMEDSGLVISCGDDRSIKVWG